MFCYLQDQQLFFKAAVYVHLLYIILVVVSYRKGSTLLERALISLSNIILLNSI